MVMRYLPRRDRRRRAAPGQGGGARSPRRSATRCAAMKVSPAPVTRVTSTGGRRGPMRRPAGPASAAVRPPSVTSTRAAPRVQSALRGLGRGGEAGLATEARLFEVDVERGAGVGERAAAAVRPCRGWPGPRAGRRAAKSGRVRDLGQKRLGQVAVERDGPAKGVSGDAEPPVGEGPQDACRPRLRANGRRRRRRSGRSPPRSPGSGRWAGRAGGRRGR